MSNVLSQALWLTVIGMGMTFLSIGALVGGIYLLTRITGSRAHVPASLPNEPISPGAELLLPVPFPGEAQDAESRRRAVAAAVATAMALAAGGRSASAAGFESPATGAWNTYVRGQHLSSRSRYESRRHGH